MNKKLKQILNRYPMLEEDRNYIANLASGGGCNCPAVLEVDFLSTNNDAIIMSDEEHNFIMNNYVNLIFKTESRMNPDEYDYYKPYWVNKINNVINFYFKEQIYSITGDGSTDKYLAYILSTHELKIAFPPV